MPSVKKKPVKRPPPNPGHGRGKAVEQWNSWRLTKMLDDLTRMYYYSFRGYEGPHPWGLQGRPPYPETQPLKVRDPVGGAPYRKIIQKHLNSPAVKQRFLRTIIELRTLLHDVDPYNPDLALKRKIKVND